jgi:hypothetical protein
MRLVLNFQGAVVVRSKISVIPVPVKLGHMYLQPLLTRDRHIMKQSG